MYYYVILMKLIAPTNEQTKNSIGVVFEMRKLLAVHARNFNVRLLHKFSKSNGFTVIAITHIEYRRMGRIVTLLWFGNYKECFIATLLHSPHFLSSFYLIILLINVSEFRFSQRDKHCIQT